MPPLLNGCLPLIVVKPASTISVVFRASLISSFTLLLLLVIAPFGILITQPFLVSSVVSVFILMVKNWDARFCSFNKPLITVDWLLLQAAKTASAISTGNLNFTSNFLLKIVY